jgi:hypothetical protein
MMSFRTTGEFERRAFTNKPQTAEWVLAGHTVAIRSFAHLLLLSLTVDSAQLASNSALLNARALFSLRRDPDNRDSV